MKWYNETLHTPKLKCVTFHEFRCFLVVVSSCAELYLSLQSLFLSASWYGCIIWLNILSFDEIANNCPSIDAFSAVGVKDVSSYRLRYVTDKVALAMSPWLYSFVVAFDRCWNLIIVLPNHISFEIKYVSVPQFQSNFFHEAYTLPQILPWKGFTHGRDMLN